MFIEVFSISFDLVSLSSTNQARTCDELFYFILLMSHFTKGINKNSSKHLNDQHNDQKIIELME